MIQATDDGSERVSAAVPPFILDTVDRFIADADSAQAALDAGTAALPSEVIGFVDGVEGKKSYRDGLLIQLAFGLLSPEKLDHTQRATGGRWAAGPLGRWRFRERVR